MHRTGRASCEEIVSSETWHPTVCVTTRCDNCVRVPNPGQHDIDKDHIGDVCSRRGPSIPVHSGPQTFMEVEWCFSPPRCACRHVTTVRSSTTRCKPTLSKDRHLETSTPSMLPLALICRILPASLPTLEGSHPRAFARLCSSSTLLALLQCSDASAPGARRMRHGGVTAS